MRKWRRSGVIWNLTKQNFEVYKTVNKPEISRKLKKDNFKSIKNENLRKYQFLEKFKNLNI
jgi:hypothetical protein